MLIARKLVTVIENCLAPVDLCSQTEATMLQEQGFKVSGIRPRVAIRHPEASLYPENFSMQHSCRLLSSLSACTVYLLEYSLSIFKTRLLNLRRPRKHGFMIGLSLHNLIHKMGYQDASLVLPNDKKLSHKGAT